MLGGQQPVVERSGKPRIAGVVTVYRQGSHADVLLGKFLPGRGIALDDGFHELRVELVAIYIDQIGSQGPDIGVDLAEEHGVPVYPSIRQALCCGGAQLAVDGVLMIGEHGDYPWNEKHQQIFPRKYFMEQICGVFSESGRAVPVFSDKHLSHSWDDARWMVRRTAELGAPFMAGSSMVTAWRRPFLEHPLGCHITEAVVLGFSGLDIYGSHTLEVLQCMVERRAGGETGVRAVTYMEGEPVWEAGDAGVFSMELVGCACATLEVTKAAGTV